MDDQAEMQSAEERLIGILAAEEGQPIEEEQPEQEEVEVEQEAETSEEETEQPAKLKLTRNGEEIEVDLEEAKALAQQGYDYTKKTQEVAEQRKAVEAQAQAIKAQETAIQEQAKMQQALIKEIAVVTALDDQISQFNAVDWNALSDSDPVQAQKLYISYQQLQNKRTQALNELNQKHQALEQQRVLSQQQRLAKAQAEVLSAFPSWNADMQKELSEVAKGYGAQDSDLASITDPWIIKALADASKYRKLQSGKPTVTNKVANKPPVVKPGGKDAKTVAKSQVSEERTRLRKTGDPNIAAKLIERLL